MRAVALSGNTESGPVGQGRFLGFVEPLISKAGQPSSDVVPV